MLLDLCVNCLKKGVICATFDRGFLDACKSFEIFFETCFKCMQKISHWGSIRRKTRKSV